MYEYLGGLKLKLNHQSVEVSFGKQAGVRESCGKMNLSRHFFNYLRRTWNVFLEMFGQTAPDHEELVYRIQQPTNN
jgi:hypothetical protein